MSEPPILLSKNRRSTVVSRRQVSLMRSGLQKARSALLKFARLFVVGPVPQRLHMVPHCLREPRLIVSSFKN